MEALHLIGGALVAGDGAAQDCVSPNDGNVWANGTLASAAQAETLVHTAHAALPAAEALSIAERTTALRALADALDAAAPALAQTITQENGCAAAQSKSLQVGSASALLRSMADLAETHRFTETRAGLRGGTVHIHKHPIGVVVGIVPWNVPLFLAATKLGPAIAAGCPIILKPSPENLMSSGMFARLLADLPLPPGMVQLATGDRDLGEALVSHPDVSKVAFTGSTAAGLRVGQACAANLTRCTLELGGKSAGILLDDVDLEAVQPELFLACLQNNGQVCGAQSRLLAPRARFDEIADWLGAMFDDLRLGDARDPQTEIGPVATPAQQARVLSMIARADAAGLTRLGGGAADLPGCHTPALLYRAEDQEAELAREEVFGPVTVLIPYDDEDHAVALSNDSAYGLSGSIWTPDHERAVALARRLKTGTVGINSKKILDFGAPFGGFRMSGVGRELGPEGINAYLETTSILG